MNVLSIACSNQFVGDNANLLTFHNTSASVRFEVHIPVAHNENFQYTFI